MSAIGAPQPALAPAGVNGRRHLLGRNLAERQPRPFVSRLLVVGFRARVARRRQHNQRERAESLNKPESLFSVRPSRVCVIHVRLAVMLGSGFHHLLQLRTVFAELALDVTVELAAAFQLVGRRCAANQHVEVPE